MISADAKVSLSLGENVGSVQITYMGVTGFICADQQGDFTRTAAVVTCKMQGYSNGIPFCCGAVRSQDEGYMMKPAWWSDVNCHGNETHLARCPRDGFWGGHFNRCQGEEQAAAVVCYNATDENGTSSEGTLTR